MPINKYPLQGWEPNELNLVGYREETSFCRNQATYLALKFDLLLHYNKLKCRQMETFVPLYSRFMQYLQCSLPSRAGYTLDSSLLFSSMHNNKAQVAAQDAPLENNNYFWLEAI